MRALNFAAILFIGAVLTIGAAPACTAAAGGGGGGGGDRLSEEEIEEANANNAYELLEQRRPRWLRTRGAASMSDPSATYPQVYIDQQRFGDLESLRQIDVRSIREMRFIRAADATTRFGTGHAGGVIQIMMR